jgi:hypothetical protein
MVAVSPATAIVPTAACTVTTLLIVAAAPDETIVPSLAVTLIAPGVMLAA